MQIPTYKQAIDYYLRPDVSQLLWDLSNRRPLRFHYYSEVDLSKGDADAHRTPYRIKLHCVDDVATLQNKIWTAAQGHEDHRPGFIPFVGMANVVNKPHISDEIIGWDMRFELDLDRKTSFRALIPILALLDHFGIPTLAKYSGHRSLHLVIPAEAFPAAMRQQVDHQAWMDAFQLLGDFFCLFSPELDRSSTRISKEMVLTTPYSFHRYYGLLSLPLSLPEAMAFDPASATLDAFGGVRWHPDQLVEQAGRMVPLLALAQNRVEHAGDIIRLAKALFAGQRWQQFADEWDVATQTADPVTLSLIAGMPQINKMTTQHNLSPKQASRLEQARLIIDSPDTKEIKFYRLVGDVGFKVPRETITAVRQTVAATLSQWVYGGLEAAIDHLLHLTVSDIPKTPIACAVRLLSFLPANQQLKVERLTARWATYTGLPPSPQAAFIALTIGELSPRHPSALAPFRAKATDALHQRVCQTDWLTEKQPETAVAMLCLAFGQNRIKQWLEEGRHSPDAQMIRDIFGHSNKETLPNKFKFAAGNVLKQVAA